MLFFLWLARLFLGTTAKGVLSTKLQHSATLTAGKLNKTLTRPHGNYQHSEFMFATVEAIHAFPPTVDIQPNGASSPGTIIKTVKYMPYYVPTLNDVVLVYRGYGRNRSSRIVLGKPNGAASPYPIPLGGIAASGAFVTGLLNLWGAIGVPSNSLGANDDWCMSQNGHIYFKSGGTWSVKV